MRASSITWAILLPVWEERSSAMSGWSHQRPAMKPTCALACAGQGQVNRDRRVSARRCNRRHGGGVGLADSADARADVAQTMLAHAERVLITEARAADVCIDRAAVGPSRNSRASRIADEGGDALWFASVASSAYGAATAAMRSTLRRA